MGFPPKFLFVCMCNALLPGSGKKKGGGEKRKKRRERKWGRDVTVLDYRYLEFDDLHFFVKSRYWNRSDFFFTQLVSGNIRPQSSELEEQLWTDPGIKMELVCAS